MVLKLVFCHRFFLSGLRTITDSMVLKQERAFHQPNRGLRTITDSMVLKHILTNSDHETCLRTITDSMVLKPPEFNKMFPPV